MTVGTRAIAAGVGLLVVLMLNGLAMTGALAQGAAREPVRIDVDAETVDLTAATREVVIRPKLQQFSDMAAANGDDAEPEPEADPSVPSDLGAGRWLLVDVVNPSDRDINRRLVLQTPTLAGSGPLGAGLSSMQVMAMVQVGEDDAARGLRAVEARNAVFAYDLTLAPREDVTLAVLVGGRVSPFALSLWQADAFQGLERTVAGGKGMLIGGLLLLALLVAGRWVMEGDGDDLAATVFVGTAILMLAAALGAHFDLVPARAPLAGGMRACAIALFAAAGLYFMRQRLALERMHPSLPGITNILAFIGIAIGLASLPGFGAEMAAGPYAAFAALFGCLVVLMMARRGEYHAPSLVPGTVFLLLCVGAAAALSLSMPRPEGALQTLALTGAIAAGTALVTLSAILTRQSRDFVDAEPAYDRLMAEPRPSQSLAPVAMADAPSPLEPVRDEDAERSALALDAARAGAFDLDVLTEFLTVSPNVDAMLGLMPGSLTGLHEGWRKRVHPEDSDLYRTAIESYIVRGHASFEFEFRVHHEDGSYRWVMLKGTAQPGDTGRADRIIGIVSDVTARKNRENGKTAEVEVEVMRDPLTGLANRPLLLDRIAHAFDDQHYAEAHGGQTPAPALLVIDIDRFKTVNEGLSHHAGDAMLAAIARRLESLVGAEDTVARIGGDEFAVFLRHGIGEEGGENAGRIVANVLSAALDVDGHEVFPSVSIGIAEAHDRSEGAPGFLRDAEIALYRAKEDGQGGICEFAPAMRAATSGRLALETALKRGVDRGEFDLLFQPVMGLRDGRLAGFEALLRWRHPERGLLAPDEFLTLAEETGAIVEIGRQGIARAVAQLNAWQARCPMDPPLFISVNVSSRQLLKPGFVEQVGAVLAPAKLPRDSLRLEVTESLIMADPEAADRALRALLDLGAGLSLDDFGTGFSSLSYLQRFPFGTLKIDRSFIAAMRDSGEAETIVRAIVSLAHDLGKSVVAEGPETEDDVRKLRAMGCDFAQGFIFGGALPVEAAEVLLTRAAGTPRKPSGQASGHAPPGAPPKGL